MPHGSRGRSGELLEEDGMALGTSFWTHEDIELPIVTVFNLKVVSFVRLTYVIRSYQSKLILERGN